MATAARSGNVRDPGILGGTPVFAGTRVPVPILFERMEAGDDPRTVLEGYPSVTRERAVLVLSELRARLLVETG